MTNFQLLLADHALNIFHLAIVIMLLTGWMSYRTRRLHRWVVSITVICWTAVAWAMGKKPGYCPVTDWHWQIKRLRGEKDIPSSYIDYLLRKVGLQFNPDLIDLAAMITLGLIVLVTLFLWWRERSLRHKAD